MHANSFKRRMTGLVVGIILLASLGASPALAAGFDCAISLSTEGGTLTAIWSCPHTADGFSIDVSATGFGPLYSGSEPNGSAARQLSSSGSWTVNFTEHVLRGDGSWATWSDSMTTSYSAPAPPTPVPTPVVTPRPVVVTPRPVATPPRPVVTPRPVVATPRPVVTPALTPQPVIATPDSSTAPVASAEGTIPVSVATPSTSATPLPVLAIDPGMPRPQGDWLLPGVGFGLLALCGGLLFFVRRRRAGASTRS